MARSRRASGALALLAAAALTAGTAGTAAGTAGTTAERPAAPGKAWKVSLKAKSDTVVADEEVLVLRGKVGRAAAGERIVLQQRLEGRSGWKRSGTFTVRRNGSFRATDAPSTGGTREYRVVKPASAGRAKGVSKEVEVTVYAWQSLGGFLGPADNLAVGTARIGTRTFAGSLVQTVAGRAGYAEFTLGRLCTDMRATQALTDASESGSTGRIVLTADGTVVSTQDLAVGTVVDTTGEIEGLFRLRVDVTSSGDPAAVPPVPSGYAAFATPEVLCAT